MEQLRSYQHFPPRPSHDYRAFTCTHWVYVCIKIYGCIIRTSQEYLAEMVVEGGTQGVSKYPNLLEPEVFMGSVRFDEFPI